MSASVIKSRMYQTMTSIPVINSYPIPSMISIPATGPATPSMRTGPVIHEYPTSGPIEVKQRPECRGVKLAAVRGRGTLSWKFPHEPKGPTNKIVVFSMYYPA